jgi:hypothetical protein
MYIADNGRESIPKVYKTLFAAIDIIYVLWNDYSNDREYEKVI